MEAFLIFACTCTSIAEAFLVKAYNRKHTRGGFVFVAFISLFSMFFFLLTDTGGFLLPEGLWIYSLIAGALYSGAFFFTYLALGCGSFAISMLVLSYSLVFSVAYGIFFLGENASAFVWVGLVLVMISLFLMREKWDGTQQHIHPKWLICIGLAFLGNGLFGVVTRMQQIAYRDAATNEFMVLALGFSFAALLLLGLLKSPSDFPYAVRHGLPYAMGAGACNGMTNLVALLLVSGLFGMPVSVTSAIRAGAKTVLSFLFSVFLLRERFEKRQVVGVLFGVAAIVFLNMQ